MAIAIDPVCGMEVDTTTSDLSWEHDGQDLLVLRQGLHARVPGRPGQVPRPGPRPVDVSPRAADEREVRRR